MIIPLGLEDIIDLMKGGDIEYIANSDDTYGAKYGILPEVVVTPKGMPNIIKPKTTEQQWQKYWGNEGAASVSRGMNQAAPIVNDALMLGLSGPGAPVSLAFEPLGILGGKVVNSLVKTKPVKYAINSLKTSKPYKLYNRIKGKDLDNLLSEEYNNTLDYYNKMNIVNRNIAYDKAPYTLHHPTVNQKEAFLKSYKRQTPTLQKINNLDIPLTDNEKYLYLHNPEYYNYMMEQYAKEPFSEHNPFSQKTVDDFIERQLSTIRGVSANDINQAEKFLTETQNGRLAVGGDRLNTNGGLYTSNRQSIANNFKNPTSSISNGYISKLRESFYIDKNLPIEEQLKQLRDRIYVYDNPLQGTVHEKALTPLKRKAIAYESNYGAGTERAYLPKGYGIKKPVNAQDILEFKNQIDQHGRWLGDFSEMPTDRQLFIPKELNAYDDYIRHAKAFLTPYKEYDKRQVDKIFNELMGISVNRRDTYEKLYDKLIQAYYRKNNIKDNIKFGSKLSGVLGVGLGPLTVAALNNVYNNKYIDDIHNKIIHGDLEYDNGYVKLSDKFLQKGKPAYELFAKMNKYNKYIDKVKKENEQN